MLLAGEFKRACAVGLVSAAIASAGIFAASRARADKSDDARAIHKTMSNFVFLTQCKEISSPPIHARRLLAAASPAVNLRAEQ